MTLPPGTYLKRPRGKTLYRLTGDKVAGRGRFGQPYENYIVDAYTKDGVLIGRRTLTSRDVRNAEFVEVAAVSTNNPFDMPRSTRGGGRKIPQGKEGGTPGPPRSTVTPGATKEGGMSALKQVEASKQLNELMNDLQNLRSKAQTQRNNLTASYRENPMPDSMVGFVKDFRFRMGGLDENPRYTFKLDTGTGLVMWVSCFTDALTPLLRGMEGGGNIAKVMNGKMMRVKADYSRGPQPEAMLEHLPGRFDYYGNPLYKSARVLRFATGDIGTILRQNSADTDLIVIEFDNYDDPETNLVGGDLVRL